MNTILITGSNKGLGLEIARQYSEAGWHVIACCRTPNTAYALQKLQTEFADQLIIHQLDVTNKTQLQSLVKKLQKQPIDILFNNAGIWGEENQSFDQIDAIPWLKVFETNTLAPLLVSQALIHQIEKSNLKIIANMSSNMGSIKDNTSGDTYAYRSSKAALNAVTKSMAIDLKDRGITVVSLHPGWVKTDMGGPNGLLNVEESVEGLKNVLDSLTLSDSGSFINYAGKKLPW